LMLKLLKISYAFIFMLFLFDMLIPILCTLTCFFYIVPDSNHHTLQPIHEIATQMSKDKEDCEVHLLPNSNEVNMN